MSFLIASGDSLSNVCAAFFALVPVLEISDFEVVESKRDFEVCDEMYSVRRKNEMEASENFGFPSVDSGRSSARS